MRSYARGRESTASPNFKTVGTVGGKTERLKLSGLYPGSLKGRSKSPIINRNKTTRIGMKGSASQLLPTTK